jgi:hypothetical protein
VQADILVQLMGSVVLAAVAGAIINGIINRRKLGAEATEIVVRAAGGQIERLEGEIERAQRQSRADRRRIRQLEISEASGRMALQVHAAWDHLAIVALQRAGVSDLPEPPPLTPPVKPYMFTADDDVDGLVE